MIAFNCQEEMISVAGDLPILAILHEDGSGSGGTNWLAPWASCNVWAYRAMSPFSQAYMGLPNGCRFIFANEHDFDQDPTRWVQYLNTVKAARPDIVLISPASDTSAWPADGQWPTDPTILSMCYFLGMHIPAFATTADIVARRDGTRPLAVTEVELDYTDPANNDGPTYRARLMQGAQAALDAGAECAVLWGKEPQYSDAIQDSLLRQTVSDFNKTKGSPMASPSNDTLQVQNGLNAQGEYDLAQALIAVMNGDKATAISLLFDGAGSTFGQLNAINPTAFPVPSRPS